MARIKYCVFSGVGRDLDSIIEEGLVSWYEDKSGFVIVARHGVNKSTLKKILKRERS